MKAIQFEGENNLVDEFMMWLYKHPKSDFNLTSVKDLSHKYDASGIEYVDDEEQKELENILNSLSDDDKKVAFSKTIDIKL